MTPEAAALVLLTLASIPALMSAINLPLFRLPRPATTHTPVSVLIPARNEAANIGRALRGVLASDHPDFEVVVMDDHSEDDTPRIVDGLAVEARHDVLLFVDADVALAPDALSRIVALLDHSPAALISGFPRQVTATPAEKLLLPLIHFVLLGFLPLIGMRRSARPAFAAGCGQLIAVRRDAYLRAGGHAAIRGSRHDGIMLPRAFRRAGEATDIFDAGPLASCRMYEGTRQVWDGLAKNADEGMASPGAIVPWTVILGGGQVLAPLLFVGFLAGGASPAATWLAGAAAGCGWIARAALAWRFGQSWLGVLLHPLGVALLLAIQWTALARGLRGSVVPWKGRTA